MNDGLTATALIVIASFTIDRIAAATFFLLTFVEPWNRAFAEPGPAGDAASARRQKLVYYVFVGILALVAVWAWDIRVLDALHAQNVPPFWDRLFTAMVLMGGSGQIAELLKAPHIGGGEKKTREPLEIRGKVTLDDQSPRAGRSSGD